MKKNQKKKRTNRAVKKKSKNKIKRTQRTKKHSARSRAMEARSEVLLPAVLTEKEQKRIQTRAFSNCRRANKEVAVHVSPALCESHL